MFTSLLIIGRRFCVRKYDNYLFPRIRHYPYDLSHYNNAWCTSPNRLPQCALSCRGGCHTRVPLSRGGRPRCRRLEPGDHHICAHDRHDSVCRCYAEQCQLCRILPAYGGRDAGGGVPQGLHARGRQSSPGMSCLGPSATVVAPLVYV